MKRNILSHTILLTLFNLTFFLYLTVSSCSAEPVNRPSCYNEDWMKRAAFIRSYISLFRASEKKIGLTDMQTDKLDEILSICTKTCIKLSSEIDEAEKDLETLLLDLDEKSDKKIIIQKVKELYALKARLDLSHFQLLGRAEDILTEEQKEKLKDIPRPTFP